VSAAPNWTPDLSDEEARQTTVDALRVIAARCKPRSKVAKELRECAKALERTFFKAA